MLEMAASGAKVLHPRAVEIAARYGIKIHLRSSFDDSTGTIVKEKGEYAAIFYKKNQLSLLDSGNFWLSPTPERASLGWDAACIRICTWGKFQDKISDSYVFYLFLLFSLPYVN